MSEKNWQRMKSDAKLKENYILSGQIRDLIRAFFKERGFFEANTPALVAAAGQEPYLSPFGLDFLDDKNKKYRGFLITSPEYSLKKLLAAGFEKVFELAKVFRQNESFGGTHNPEFTMLEWYRQNSDYSQIMKDTEELVSFLAQKIRTLPYGKNLVSSQSSEIKGPNIIEYQGQKIDLTPPWPRLTVRELFQKYANVDLESAKTLEDFRAQAGPKYKKFNDWNDVFYLIFLNDIEPNLPKDKPVFICDYPLPQASLSKRKSEGSFWAERFEIFIAGMELGNAFSELVDAQEQEARFKEENALRKESKKEEIPVDKDLLSALRLGIAPSGGIAVGVERLEMLLLDIKDINDLLPFPASQLFTTLGDKS
jgi:elongation factor P--(R)-beta-lysine ligase